MVLSMDPVVSGLIKIKMTITMMMTAVYKSITW